MFVFFFVLLFIGGLYLGVSKTFTIVKLSRDVVQLDRRIHNYLRKQLFFVAFHAKPASVFVRHREDVLTDVIKWEEEGYLPSTMNGKKDMRNRMNDARVFIAMLAKSYPEIQINMGYEDAEEHMKKMDEKIVTAIKMKMHADRRYREHAQSLSGRVVKRVLNINSAKVQSSEENGRVILKTELGKE